MTNAASDYWVYEYDDLGQVTSGRRFWADGTPVAGQQYEFTFDTIGNLLTTETGGDSSGAGLRPATYTANHLNQYTNRTVPGYVDTMGLANANATITVNGQPVYRKGEYFRAEVPATNTASLWVTLTNVGILNAGGSNPDLVSTNLSHAFVAATPVKVK